MILYIGQSDIVTRMNPKSSRRLCFLFSFEFLENVECCSLPFPYFLTVFKLQFHRDFIEETRRTCSLDKSCLFSEKYKQFRQTQWQSRVKNIWGK